MMIAPAMAMTMTMIAAAMTKTTAPGKRLIRSLIAYTTCPLAN